MALDGAPAFGAVEHLNRSVLADVNRDDERLTRGPSFPGRRQFKTKRRLTGGFSGEAEYAAPAARFAPLHLMIDRLKPQRRHPS